MILKSIKRNSNLYLSLILSLLLAEGTIAQKREIRLAKQALKRQDYYNAAFNSAQALQKNYLSKGNLKSAQSLLFESKDKAFSQTENIIKSDREKSVIFINDETVSIRDQIVVHYEKLINLQELLLKIPEPNKVSQSKKVPYLKFDHRDYSTQLTNAKRLLKESKQLAAEKHYNKAVEYSKKILVTDLVRSYEEFQLVFSFIPEYKDAKKLQLEVGIKIGHIRLEEGNELISTDSPENIIEALRIFDEGLKYTSLKELADAKKKARNSLSEAYYQKALSYLNQENKTVHDYSFNRGYMGIGAPKDDDLFERVRVTSIDNSHAAMEYLNKLKEIDADYKDSKNLRKKAWAGTTLQDPRNKKGYWTFKTKNLVWMEWNLDFEVPNSAYYTYVDTKGQAKVDKEKGRYYTAEAVKTNLNNLCPDDWRIPSIEDYQELAEFIALDKAGVASFKLSGYGTSSSESTGDKFAISQEGVSTGFWSSTPLKYLYVGTKLAHPSKGVLSKYVSMIATSIGTSYFHCRCVKDYVPSEY
ncbi:MAG: FISUMP domain-containing protein [Cyclobacteriaceae bacterium]